MNACLIHITVRGIPFAVTLMEVIYASARHHGIMAIVPPDVCRVVVMVPVRKISEKTAFHVLLIAIMPPAMYVVMENVIICWKIVPIAFRTVAPVIPKVVKRIRVLGMGIAVVPDYACAMVTGVDLFAM